MSADKVTRDGKLKNLECLFTWDVDKDDINDLKGIPEKLLDRIKFCPRKYHATYFNILAFVSHLQGKPGTALAYLGKSEAVLKEDKRDEADFLVTYSSFAWLHHHMGNLDDMETYLGKVKSTGEGREVTVEAEKGWSFIRLGAKFYPRAKESFQKALKAKPDSVSYNVGYAVVLYRLEELVRTDFKVAPEDSLAAKQLQRALDLDPADAEVMVHLALKLQGFNPLKCRELIRKALMKCPDSPQITRFTDTYFRREGFTEESLEILEEAAKRAPNSSFLYHQMGLCHWQNMIDMKKSCGWRTGTPQVKAAIAETIRLFRKTVELKPSNTYAWVHLAEAYGESQQLERAEPIFTRLLSDESLSDAEQQHCHNKYGSFLMYRRKNHAKAIEQFKKAYKIRIDSRDRSQAREKLVKLAGQKSKMRAQEGDNILAFLSAVDKQDRQPAPAAAAAAAAENVKGLADSFQTKMTL
ncbi:interferon-induced protein with tetratricopeptide repeats 5-like [Clupea harengus]|uniref:Interferon-induced protein with tetratricopeptide repeats 5-like n=1 Tax=Clupea harengus TaxID=7950 RepID=A0A6P3W3Y7_CLUHA|nr:interferon-induced protein with tetratricopeptide repeats 5-like [Clupea harengus]